MSDMKKKLDEVADEMDCNHPAHYMLKSAADYIEKLEKDAAIGAFLRKHVNEGNDGWSIPPIYIPGAPSMETFDDVIAALSHTN